MDFLRAVGNQEVQRLVKSGKLRGQSNIRDAGSAAPGPHPVAASKSPAAKSAPPSTREAAVPPAAAPRADVAIAVPSDGADVLLETAPVAARVSPENDAGYHAVVRKLGTNASRQKTPVKDTGAKVGEISVAAELPPARQKEKRAYQQQMDDLAAAPVPTIEDFTVEKFMEAFRLGFEELAKQLPKASEDNHAVSNAVDFGSERKIAVQGLTSQRDDKSRALRQAASHDPHDIAAAIPAPPAAPELNADPAGPLPAIPNAAAAAPKPLPAKDISLDAQSQALDDSFKNQVAGGQVLNISEDSLPYAASGEKSFDEASEAKRKAQEMIRRILPRYRSAEAAALNKAKATVNDAVHTGLQDFHGARQQSFGGVLEVQKHHEQSVEIQKDAVLSQFELTYTLTKGLVELELVTLNGIGEKFEGILTAVENKLKAWVRNDLEYIYTPGILDYSDWIDEKKPDVLKERDRLARENPDELEMFRYAKALRTVQDRDAKRLFEQAKQQFLIDVTAEARNIAVEVVEALNRANKHIRDGQATATKIYNGLSTREKAQYTNAYTAVMGQYTTLAETVADRHREIVGDMARSYHKVAGTLQATFEAIRKDVLTSWWEKAWNKIKAVVGAIVEFATRIAELLGEMLRLLGDIISSPRYFFNNLVTGIGRGLSTFVEHIDTFLADAFFDWLRGSTGVSVQLPKDWDPKGIFGLFTQLLNLSTETIWQRMEVVYDTTVANAFRRGEVLFEKGLELFAIVKTEGLGGLWSHIKESLGTILKDTLESMKETILYAAIKKVMIEVGKLLVPGGGFIAIAEKIIRLLVFIFEARNQILNLIQSFVQSMEDAVKGDVSGIVSRVTGALKSFITFALDFLVAFFGLGGLKSKIERVIDRMRSPIIRGIDWVLGKAKPIVMKAKGVAGKIKERAVALLEWWRERRQFRGADDKPHSVFVQGGEHSRRLVVATQEREVTAVLVAIINLPAPDDRQNTARQALEIYNTKLAPVIHERADVPLQQQFPANLTALTNLLVELVGVYTQTAAGAAALQPTAPPTPGISAPTAPGPRPPFVLRLPRQKAPHLNNYRRWLGVLQSDPNYDRGEPAQLEIWHQALRLGGSHGIPASVYERGHRLGLTGENGERRIRVPNWSRRGDTLMEVDHVIELQVTPQSMRAEFNSVSNFELLDRDANGSSGPLLSGNIRQERARQVAFDPSAASRVLIFDQVVLDGGTSGLRWSVEEIRAGEQLDVFEEE